LKGSLRMVALRGHERDDNDIATTREYLIGVAVADVLPPACPIVVGEKVPEREDRGGTPLKHAAQSRPSIGREGVPPPLALLRLDAAAYLRKAPYGESVTMIAVRVVCAVSTRNCLTGAFRRSTRAVVRAPSGTTTPPGSR
jgi:hypothetical protein